VSRADQELEARLRSAAVPITSAAGKVAALSLSVHASRAGMDDLREQFVPKVLETARASGRGLSPAIRDALSRGRT
jgi:IclR family pca regulon transcriptional regulator